MPLGAHSVFTCIYSFIFIVPYHFLMSLGHLADLLYLQLFNFDIIIHHDAWHRLY